MDPWTSKGYKLFLRNDLFEKDIIISENLGKTLIYKGPRQLGLTRFK